MGDDLSILQTLLSNCVSHLIPTGGIIFMCFFLNPNRCTEQSSHYDKDLAITHCQGEGWTLEHNLVTLSFKLENFITHHQYQDSDKTKTK